MHTHDARMAPHSDTAPHTHHHPIHRSVGPLGPNGPGGFDCAMLTPEELDMEAEAGGPELVGTDPS